MKHEFKVTRSKEQTVYTLESATSMSTADIATVDSTLGGMQRRNPPGDNILAQEKKETPKPRNFVAKNAKMGGAGQHKDKKKAAKQGDVKHKKPLAESYAEDLAKQVFDANPNINDENAVLDAAWPIVVQDLGKKTAMSMFNYDEDFPSDLVSVYDWLQKNQQGVAEDDDSRDKFYYQRNNIWRVMDGDELVHEYTPDRYEVVGAKKLLARFDDEGYDVTHVISPMGTVTYLYGKPEDDMEEGFNGEYDDEAGMAHSNLLTSARAVIGLLKTIDDRDNLPEWAQEKIAKAEMMLVSVWDYLQSQKAMGNDPQVDMEEGVGMPFRGVGGAFNRGDDERHDLDVPRQPMPQQWALKINGTVDGNNIFTDKEQALQHRLNLLAKNPELEIGLVSRGGVAEDAYTESLMTMLERSVSQAQHNLMVGVAHNPAFAQKVKVKQKVGQEFANADQGHDISKLPIRVPKKK